MARRVGEECFELTAAAAASTSASASPGKGGYILEGQDGDEDDNDNLELLGARDSAAAAATAAEMGQRRRKPWEDWTWRDPRVVLSFLSVTLILVVTITASVENAIGGRLKKELSELRDVYDRVSYYEDYSGRPRKVVSKDGVVASDQGFCSELGAGMLGRGGNAVDATVATAFCLGVMNPFASGIGGGAFILVRMSNGTTEAIDAREVAPAAASQDMYKDIGEAAAVAGGLSVAVPMELLGLHAAWQRHGKLPWKDLVMPSAELAEKGYGAHPDLVRLLTIGQGVMKEFDALYRIYFPNDKLPAIGQTCCSRPDFARTLERIAEEGPDVLYTGEVAAELAREVQDNGGIIIAEDLARARPVVREALHVDVLGKEVIAFPPPSSGAIVIAILKQIEARRLPVRTSGVLGKHWLVEATKNAYAIRMSLGDPGTEEESYLNMTLYNQVLADLLSTEHAELLVSETLDNATKDPGEYGGRHKPPSFMPDDGGTSHISVVDRDMNAVSMTTTINDVFGSNIVSPSTGIILNDEMDDFSIPGESNMFGYPPSESNFIRPGKRPLSSMSPIIVTEPNLNASRVPFQVSMVIGASGGSKIINAVVQVMLNYIDLGLDPLDAVEAPRLHHQLFPDTLRAENVTLDFWVPEKETLAVPQTLLAGLEAFGHTVETSLSLGNCQMIVVNQTTGAIAGVSDIRKDGAPAAPSSFKAGNSR